MTSAEYCKTLEKLLRTKATRVRAEGAKAYLRGQFECIGVDTTTRRDLFRKFLRENGLPSREELDEVIRELWQSEFRELHYCAMEIMWKMKKQFRKDDLDLIEFMITNNSWWDTVDFIAARIVNYYFHLFPATTLPVNRRWLKSGNIWLMRTAIIFQLHPADPMNEELLYHNILHCASHRDFFIRKAIGWALRQHAKKHPAAVKRFLKAHGEELSPLSVREASKHIG